MEYALPQSEIPTLAEALIEDDGDDKSSEIFKEEPIASAALQAELLQAVSQQLTQAQVLITHFHDHFSCI